MNINFMLAKYAKPDSFNRINDAHAIPPEISLSARIL